MTKLKKRVKKNNRYPEELKRKIAKEYLSGRASYRILAEEHGLRNKDVVKEFVRWYKRQLLLEEAALESMEKTRNKQDKKPDDQRKKEVSEMEKELAELRKKLTRSELKVEMLETMIDVAESELSIDIRKKSGTNQS